MRTMFVKKLRGGEKTSTHLPLEKRRRKRKSKVGGEEPLPKETQTRDPPTLNQKSNEGKEDLKNHNLSRRKENASI